jgi:hypothetical protein
VSAAALVPPSPPEPSRATPAPPQPAIYSLKSIPVPKPPDLERYVRDEQALVVLGKALFWDTQVSSDNRVACASCHFHAGADHRPQNQLSATKGEVRPNQVMNAANWSSLHDAVRVGSRVASAGIFPRQLAASVKPARLTRGSELTGAEYQNIHGLNVRQVGKRNCAVGDQRGLTTSAISDGRASDIFTGRTPLATPTPRRTFSSAEAARSFGSGSASNTRVWHHRPSSRRSTRGRCRTAAARGRCWERRCSGRARSPCSRSRPRMACWVGTQIHRAADFPRS